MVESEAEELTEDQMLGAVLFAHQQMQPVLDAIAALVAEAGKPRWEWTPPEIDQTLADRSSKRPSPSPWVTAYRITDKLERQDAVAALKDPVPGAVRRGRWEKILRRSVWSLRQASRSPSSATPSSTARPHRRS